VKHYYFHIMDREWGHVTIRICGYPPFGAQLILNGHAWVERKAWRKCLTAVKHGNCFVEGSDFAAPCGGTIASGERHRSIALTL
jgi:hypothetical protein